VLFDQSLAKVGSYKKLFALARRQGVNVESELERAMAVESDLFTTVGFKVLKVGRGRVELSFPFSRAVARRGGIVHGGVVMYSLDNACGFAAMSINPGVDQRTMELKVNFLRPLKKGPFRAVGRVVRAGNSVAVVEGEVRDADGSLCAKSLGTWFLIRSRANTG
jgi:acyl-CoA thioesterase